MFLKRSFTVRLNLIELYAGSVWLFCLFSPREIMIKDEAGNRHPVWQL